MSYNAVGAKVVRCDVLYADEIRTGSNTVEINTPFPFVGVTGASAAPTATQLIPRASSTGAIISFTTYNAGPVVVTLPSSASLVSRLESLGINPVPEGFTINFECIYGQPIANSPHAYTVVMGDFDSFLYGAQLTNTTPKIRSIKMIKDAIGVRWNVFLV
jgi:hypothetical protein